VHRSDDLVRVERKVCRAVVAIQVGERRLPCALTTSTLASYASSTGARSPSNAAWQRLPCGAT
jgi:hypothetical protein